MLVLVIVLMILRGNDAAQKIMIRIMIISRRP